MTKPLVPANKTRLLLVEGKEDQEFFIQLARHEGYDTDTWPLHILQCEGRNQLNGALLQLAYPD